MRLGIALDFLNTFFGGGQRITFQNLVDLPILDISSPS